MDYSELTSNVQDICEQVFTADQLALFTKQAERRIYLTIQFPDLRKSDTLVTVSGTATVTLPSDYLYMYSLAVIDGSSNYHFLLNKDVNFIREAYPAAATTSLPKHYAQSSDTEVILGPTPDAVYSLEINYGYFPASIVTETNTWLGDNFSNVLLNATLIEAARFMKEEADIIQNYEKLYLESLALAKNLGDGKLRQDTYRSGQYREPVS